MSRKLIRRITGLLLLLPPHLGTEGEVRVGRQDPGRIDVWTVLSSLLETAREELLRFGTVRPIVVTLWRGREPETRAVATHDKGQFYSSIEREADSPECIAVAQIQTQKFTYEGILYNAATVSAIAENVGKIGLAQPYRKRKEEYSFEIPIALGTIAGGLNSGDYIWHHIADRWTSIETVDAELRSLEDSD